MTHAALSAEVDRNYDVFLALLPQLLSTRRDQYALLRRGEIVCFFETEPAALRHGRDKFDDGLYSVQQVSDAPADLGFFSHAVDHRLA